jgi:hypothetical protein
MLCCTDADRRRSAKATPTVNANSTNDRKAMLPIESGWSKLISMALFPFAGATDCLFEPIDILIRQLLSRLVNQCRQGVGRRSREKRIDQPPKR